MNFRSNLACKNGFTVLGAEDQMYEEAGKRLWHFGSGNRVPTGRKLHHILTQAGGLGYGILRPWRSE